MIKKGYARRSQLIDYFEVTKPPSNGGDVRPFEEKYVRTEDIIKGLQYLLENGREDRYVFAKLIIYSGLRAIDAVRLLQTYDPSLVQEEDIVTGQKFHNFVRYPLFDFIKGENKLKFYAYFPKSFLEELRRFEDMKKSRVDRREFFGYYFEPQQLRKWNENFLMDTGGRLMPELKDLPDVVDFIQGRVSRRVGSRHYRYLQEKANELYGKVADKFPV